MNLPKAMYKDITEIPFESKTKCPAVAGARNRIFEGYPPFTIEFEFGLNASGDTYAHWNILDSEVFMSENIKQLVFELIRVTNNNNKFVDFQMQLPYCFITDDKDLEVLTAPPINMEYENCYYLAGAYRPYGWIRNQNSAWIVEDIKKPAKVKFDINKPCIQYIFNKPVDLSYTEKTEKMQNFILQNMGILNYKHKLYDTYKTVLSRRPDKLL